MRVIHLRVPDSLDGVVLENLYLITQPDVPVLDDETRVKFLASVVAVVLDKCLLAPDVAVALLDLNGAGDRRERVH